MTAVKKRLIYIDQLVGPTSLDIINALSQKYEVHLYYGGIIKTYADLDPGVKLFRRKAYSKKSFFSRIVSWFLFYLVTFPLVMFKRRKDEFFLVSNPPLNHLIGYLFNRMLGIRFNLLLFDVYPDIIIQYGYLSARNPLSKWWAFGNRVAFPKAHRVFTLSDNLCREVRKYDPKTNNLVVVPNWVNSEEIKPMPRDQNQFIKQHGLEEAFIVMYSGNMGKTHDLETIVETAKLLTAYPRIKFILIGDGTKKPKIVSDVAETRLSNVTILPFQEPDLFKHSIASADIGFVTLSEGFESYSVPSKMYYLMAAGCIIFAIAGKESEMESIINNYQCGFRFNHGDAQGIAAGIVRMYENQELKNRIGMNSRTAADQFTEENAKIIANEVAGS